MYCNKNSWDIINVKPIEHKIDQFNLIKKNNNNNHCTTTNNLIYCASYIMIFIRNSEQSDVSGTCSR